MLSNRPNCFCQLYAMIHSHGTNIATKLWTMSWMTVMGSILLDPANPLHLRGQGKTNSAFHFVLCSRRVQMSKSPWLTLPPWWRPTTSGSQGDLKDIPDPYTTRLAFFPSRPRSSFPSHLSFPFKFLAARPSHRPPQALALPASTMTPLSVCPSASNTYERLCFTYQLQIFLIFHTREERRGFTTLTQHGKWEEKGPV